MGGKDIAISELTHVARKLMERLAETDDNFISIMQQAVSNKIDYMQDLHIASSHDHTN